MRHPLGTITAWAIALSASSTAEGQTAVPASATRTAPTRQAQAIPIAGESIRLDGQLTEAVWQRAVFADGFLQKDPAEGQPSTVRTEVAFAFDGDALYIGARMESQGPGDIRAVVSRRDNPANSERLIISLDSYHDGRTAYTFGVTATGVRFEYYHGQDSEHDRDYSFNPVWQAATVQGERGWTAEMRIPFSQLRFNAADQQVWGVNINRYMPSRNEDAYWILIPKNETGWASRFAPLTGISGIRPSRRLELLPYVASSSRLTGDRNARNPFDDGTNIGARVGADLKMGLGPNLTLDATVNPDFGQVEADPAEVNLGAVPTFFGERRPFFTEGSQLFRARGANYFYSRRIGAPPPGGVAGDFRDVPAAATILGAAKVTGRLASGTSVGTLFALTDREMAQGFDSATAGGPAVRREAEVAPRTGYGVARVQQEFGASASTIGAMATGVWRDLEGGTPLADQLTRQAYAGAVDWNLRFQGGTYELRGGLGFSHVMGDSAALSGLQRNFTHYYQRPDQDHVRYDPSRTSLTGWNASLNFEKNSGTHWRYEVSLSAESPGFEINDAGRLGTADDIDYFGSLRYQENQPGSWYQSYNLGLFSFGGWNFGGIQQYQGFDLETSVTWKNFSNTFFSVEVFPGKLSDGLTRGGPLMRSTDEWNLNGGYSSSFSNSTQWNVFALYGWESENGYFARINAGVTLRPSSRWQVSLQPSFFRGVNPRQYVSQRADGSRPETFGTRYIFGTVDRTTLAAQFRLSYSLTPDMTVEFYAEPFAASGQYRNLGELERPRTNDLRLYGTDGSTISQGADGSFAVQDGADSFTLSPNFNVLSFRSNAVFRWEWRPGSTLFLVWQQDRSGRQDLLERSRPGDLWRSLSATGDNLLAVKVSYWLPVP